MKKYLVVMNWDNGTLNVYENYPEIVNDLKLKDSTNTWEFFDELPDFDESLLLDCGKSYGYLTVFDFIQNKGITIPLTENQFNNAFNEIDEVINMYSLNPGADWYLSENAMEYVTHF